MWEDLPAADARPQEGHDGRVIREIFNIHQLDEVFAQGIRHSFIVACCRQLLGLDVYVHQAQVNYKKAFIGRQFYWHQDFSYWHYEDGMPAMRALTVMIFLSDIGVEHGPLLLLPGSHRSFNRKQWPAQGKAPNEAVRHDDPLYDPGALSPPTLRELWTEDLFVATGPKGSLLLFDSNVAHASAGNLGLRDRRVLCFCYNSVDNRLHNPKRPTYITNRDVHPL